MKLRQGMLLLALTLVLGCGGARPTPFSEKMRPLGQAMEKAVQKKDRAEMTKILDKAKAFREQGHLRSEELEVLNQVEAYANADDWEAANKLIVDSNRIKTDE
ncbi:MAG: hypothetical protein U1D30_21190 [Planctomycetota bacterium]